VTLTPGSRLGPYEITTALGAGGMGEVYRARDTKLHRDVAIKVLPELFSADPERLARFEREAQVLASINHPNIAAIYGLQEMGPAVGGGALVLELVEGLTLADRITQGPMSIDDVLSTARQIAEALEAAHAHGIVHRDLKPANIKLTPGGTVKVLDFGLAKAVTSSSDTSLAHSPTFTSVGTHYGVILGTAAYMAPEQARGKAVDHRADIWAFGVVLYEMLTGRALFLGDTASEILARVIEREPDWTQVPSATPAPIVRLVRRCLMKDPHRRLQSMGDARVEIEEALAGTPDTAPVAPAARRRAWLWPAIAAAGVLASAAMAVMLWRSYAAQSASPSIRAAIPLPSGLYLDGNGPPELALSPDGRTLAFLARGATGFQQLYVRRLDAETATPVAGSETGEGPFFSPDGRWVAFAVGVSGIGIHPAELRKYSIDTGLTQTICPLDDYFGGVWTADDTILLVDGQPMGIRKVSAGGGRPENLVPRFRIGGQDIQRAVSWPDLLPDGKSMLVTDWGQSVFGDVAIVDLETRELVRLGVEGNGARFLPSGHVVYANRNATLMAAPFDPVKRRFAGTAVALMSDVALGRGGVPVFAFAPNGTFVYATGYLRWSRREPMRLIRVTRTGQTSVLPFEPDLFRRGFAISPDGESLVAGTWGDARWLFDLSRGTRIKLGSEGTTELTTVAWSPDGRRLAMAGSAAENPSLWGVFAQNGDGSGRVETLVPPVAGEIHVAGWMPDGRSLVCWEITGVSITAIIRFDHGSGRHVILEERGGIVSAQSSPDGRWVAFDSTASGTAQIYVTPLSQARRIAVTSGGGRFPVWSRDGRELFFRRDRAVIAVSVSVENDRIRFGPEQKLFEWNVDANREFAVGRDGSFYSVEAVPGAAQQTSIQLRTDWFTEVARRAAGARR
jgi:Tol biopolymer transport system component/tRNA A-37 threonylcarbamoyl transferase component Bud32